MLIVITTVLKEYIDDPFLINDLKFDISLYILVSSIDPLQLYVFEDGIVKFATEKYTKDR